MSEQQKATIHPTHIAVHQKSRKFEIHFSDGSEFNLPFEYLRVFSPSAEVRVAKKRGELILGKERVNIDNVEPMGSYAVRLLFDDGHDTGVYSWSTLKELGDKFESNWKDYQQQLEEFQKLNQGETKITVLFFIGLVDALGVEKLELNLPDDNQKVSDVIQLLADKGGDWKDALNPDSLTITVNKQFSNIEQKLFNGDEVAFVPKK
ncbi:MAG: DUF971 domain-containing protein [Thiotrichaceae bacterium]|nr:DUF971 domain-containing protein [Thiotrichaceae bacterium]